MHTYLYLCTGGMHMVAAWSGPTTTRGCSPDRSQAGQVTCSAADVESEVILGHRRRQPAATRAVGVGLRTAGRFFSLRLPRFRLAAHAAARKVQVRLSVRRRARQHSQR